MLRTSARTLLPVAITSTLQKGDRTPPQLSQAKKPDSQAPTLSGPVRIPDFQIVHIDPTTHFLQTKHDRPKTDSKTRLLFLFLLSFWMAQDTKPAYAAELKNPKLLAKNLREDAKKLIFSAKYKEASELLKQAQLLDPSLDFQMLEAVVYKNGQDHSGLVSLALEEGLIKSMQTILGKNGHKLDFSPLLQSAAGAVPKILDELEKSDQAFTRPKMPLWVETGGQI